VWVNEGAHTELGGKERGCIQVTGRLYTIKKQGQTFKGKIWEKYFDENIVRKV
jgi:hypothetical protein